MTDHIATATEAPPAKVIPVDQATTTAEAPAPVEAADLELEEEDEEEEDAPPGSRFGGRTDGLTGMNLGLAPTGLGQGGQFSDDSAPEGLADGIQDGASGVQTIVPEAMAPKEHPSARASREAAEAYQANVAAKVKAKADAKAARLEAANPTKAAAPAVTEQAADPAPAPRDPGTMAAEPPESVTESVDRDIVQVDSSASVTAPATMVTAADAPAEETTDG